MRIALIAPLVSPIAEPQLGGAQSVLADLARGLATRGHEVVVYASRGSTVDGGAMADVDIDASELQADMFRAGMERVASPAMHRAYHAVYAHVRDGRFDMVHNHGFDAPAVSAAAELGVPVLHTLHLPPSPVIAAAIRHARRTSAGAWCAAVSRAHAAAWRKLIAVDALLANGVPVSEVRFGAGTPRSAVIAARFSAEKGMDEGIAAARLAGWSVEVYGTPYDPAYERSTRVHWADDGRVRFHDPVRRVELWDALGDATAAICMSRWDEPFGMVAAEAQAAGTPVVASRAGGLPEVIRDGLTGFLVPPGDVAAAAAALASVGSLSRDACRAHAERALDLADSVSAHEVLYARLAGRE